MSTGECFYCICRINYSNVSKMPNFINSSLFFVTMELVTLQESTNSGYLFTFAYSKITFSLKNDEIAVITCHT